MTYKLLRIDASSNPQLSTSGKLADHFQGLLQQQQPGLEITRRDIAQGLPMINQDWIAASFTQEEERNESQHQQLQLSDQLIEELVVADHVLLSTPMYNFSVPSTLKAWIDLIARAGKTFQYTADGPQGLLHNKPVTIIVSTGGTPVNSAMDFLTDYLQHIFRFIGIQDISVIAADRMNIDADSSFQNATVQINRLFNSSEQAA